MKHRAYQPLLWLLAACLLLTGCSSPVAPNNSATVPIALPTVAPQYVAPIGDAALEYTADAVFYLPRYDETRLTALNDKVTFSAARPHAESLVRALLAHPGNGAARSLGGEVKLALYGANPVEVSGGVATVNLAASALQLTRRDYYIVCQAIANTLTESQEIDQVNVLVMDRQLGLDIAETLPTGAFSRSLNGDVAAAYEQLLSNRVVTGESPESKKLASSVTLYFPLSGKDGILSEARTLSFDSQDPARMIRVLLSELSLGPQAVSGSPALPLLADMLTREPQISEAATGAGRQVTLRFAHNLNDMLDTFGISRAACLASLCYTITTFFPNISGVVFYIGDEAVQSVTLQSDAVLSWENALATRTSFAPLLLDECTLYFSDAGSQKLVKVFRPIPYHLTANPRALTLELAKGPQNGDRPQGTKPVMPPGAIKDSDLLGFSLNGQTLLVNFAPAFVHLGEGISRPQDRLLAYSLTNTLCANSTIRKIRFFVAGEIPHGFTPEIFWGGDFFPTPGLVQAQQ